jgi:hypothetical protein
MLPSALATALGLVLLPGAVQASWLSEALHRQDAERPGVRYVLPPAPAPHYTVRYTPTVIASYEPPVVPVAPAPVAPVAPPAYGLDRAAVLIDRIADKLQTLREDVAVEAPGARGVPLTALAAELDDEAEHLQRDLRAGETPEHLWKHAVEVDRGLHEFLEASDALGEGGEYLHRSAFRIENLDHSLMRLLSPGSNPEALER